MPHFHYGRDKKYRGAVAAGPGKEGYRILFLWAMGVMLCLLFLDSAGGLLRETAQRLTDGMCSVLGRRTGWEGIILRKRCIFLALWLVIGFTPWRPVLHRCFWIWFGFAAGMLAWSVFWVWKWKGPWYLWALVFPQYLGYLPAMFLLYAAYYGGSSPGEQISVRRRSVVCERQRRLFWGRILLGISLYGAGIWAEIQLNPWILTKIFIKS